MGRLFLIIAKRIVPVEVFSAHWKALADYRRTPVTPDWIARFAVVLIPAIVFVVMWGTSGSLTAPAALLTGMALLAGGLLSAFSQLSALRLKLSDRLDKAIKGDSARRDHLDETAAHLLVAAYMAALTAVLLVIGMNVSTNAHGALTGLLAWSAASTSVHVALVFFIALPRLYVGYASVNGVRKELDGTHSNYR